MLEFSCVHILLCSSTYICLWWTTSEWGRKSNLDDWSTKSFEIYYVTNSNMGHWLVVLENIYLRMIVWNEMEWNKKKYSNN
jgi:hypothetical protein